MSVISIPRLPDQVDVKFGPADAVAEMVLATDRSVRNCGIRLSLSTDFDEMLRVNQQNQADWYRITPNFDPRECALGRDNAFWVKGINAEGETVLCHAVRLYVLHDTSLKEEIERLRFYFDDTERARAAGVRTEVDAPSAQMTGRLAYSGALWVRSDFRGLGLARTIPPLSRALSLSQWYPEHHTCFLMQPTVEKGMARVYGYERQEYAIRLHNLPGFPPALKTALCWKTADEVTAEIECHALGVQGRVGIGFERQRRNEARVMV